VNRLATRKEVVAMRKRSGASNAPAARNGAAAAAPDATPAAPVASASSTSSVSSKTSTARASAVQGQQQPAESLEQCVFRSLDQYFADLDGAKPHALHEMVLGAIEKPLLQFALQRCEGNQSAAADLLGINRNTLRRKLQDYGLH